MNFNWILEYRASGILYNILKSIRKDYIFILPANICPIVPVTFLKANIKFIFLDISLETLCIDLFEVKKAIKKIDYPGLLYVRNMGIEHDVNNEFKDFKKTNQNLLIIDDRCQSKISFNIEDICSFSDVTLFSTGYAKYLDFGFGGLGLINNDTISYTEDIIDFNENSLSQLTSELRNSFLTQTKFIYKENNWLNTEKLKLSFNEYRSYVEENNQKMIIHKEKINNIYINNIPEFFIPQYDFDINTWRFTIFSENKNIILNKLFLSNFFASSHYASRSHLFGGRKAINAEIVHNKIINLFNNLKVTEEMALSISSIIKSTV